MRRHALIAAMLALMTALPAGSLDGTRWRMRYRSARAWLPLWKADVMAFDAGRFSSLECASYGFSDSPYRAERRGRRTVWSTVQHNKDGERARWRGVLTGDKMTGTLTWTQPNGRSRLFTFSAQPRKLRGERRRIGEKTPGVEDAQSKPLRGAGRPKVKH